MASAYLLLRREAPPHAAGVATLSMGLILALSWEGQRALTHSATALLMAPLTAWAALRALRRGGWGDWLLLGAAAGLGLLSKLNMAVWGTGLLAAALVLPGTRRRVRPVRLLAAVAVMAALNLPALAWSWANPALATEGLGKLQMEAGGLAARLQGTGSLLGAVLTFYALPLVVLGTAWLLARPKGAALPPGLRLVALASALSLGMLWLVVLGTGSTRIDYMWLLPFGWPPVALAVVAAWPGLSGRARRAVGAAGGGAWLLALVALPAVSLVTAGSVNRWLDYGPLAARLVDLEPEGRPVVLTNVPLAGNLVLRAPSLEPGLLTVAAPDLPDGPALLVARIDDPLLASPEVVARTEAVERFDPLPRAGDRQVAVVRLSARVAP